MTSADAEKLDLLSALTRNGVRLTLKTDCGQHGAEYSAKCPFPSCSSENDAFIVWAERSDGGPRFWCRKCRRKGYDVFDFYYHLDGQSTFSTAKYVLKLDDISHSYNVRRGENSGTFNYQYAPKTIEPPPLDWRACMASALKQMQTNLHKFPVVRQSLYNRGLSDETVQAAGIGINHRPQSIYIEKATIAVGIAIPNYRKDTLYSIKIRRFDEDVYRYGEERYSAVKGSKQVPLILNPESKVVFVVEGDFDAILLDQECEHSFCIIAIGTNTNLDFESDELVQKAEKLIISLDADDAGRKAANRLSDRYKDAIIKEIPEGKDACDSYQKGVDLKQWLHNL